MASQARQSWPRPGVGPPVGPAIDGGLVVHWRFRLSWAQVGLQGLDCDYLGGHYWEHSATTTTTDRNRARAGEHRKGK